MHEWVSTGWGLVSRAPRLRWLSPLGALATGAALGWLAWRPEGTVVLIALLPLLWTLQPTRAAAALLWFGYFLAGSCDLVPVVGRFFPNEPWAFGIALWALDAAVLALPWVLVWPRARAASRSVFGRTAAALVLLTVPPLGCLAWLSPLLAGGLLYPGWGWIGVACAFGVFGLFATVGRMVREGKGDGIRDVMGPVTGLFVVAIVANLTYRPSLAPEGWVALDTRLGRFPADRYAGFERHQDLMRSAKQAIGAGAKVVILPEEVAGTWRTAVEYWWHPIDELAARHNATVLVGADVPVSPGLFEEDAPRFTDSVVMLGATQGRADARVPIPVASWRPWAKEGAVANLAGSGIIEIQGIRAALSICYEDFLAWPVFRSLALGPKPQLLLSVANNWFAEGLDSFWIQRRSIELWARLFGVPLLRSANVR